MKQLLFGEDGQAALREVPEPRLRPGCVLVRSTASLLMAEAGLGGTPPGFSGAGVIAAVGEGMEGRFRVGQRVAIGGRGVAGLADYNVVPGVLAAPVPDDANDEEACFAALAAAALHGVRALGLQVGHVAAVVGVDMAAQLAVQFLVLSGVRVAAVESDAAMLDLARFAGAELCWNPDDGDPWGPVGALTSGRGCDGVLVAAAASEAALRAAAAVAADRARIVLLGETAAPLPQRDLVRKELTITASRSFLSGRVFGESEDWSVDGRDLADTARLQTRRTDRRLHVEPLITHRIPFENAEAAFRMVRDNTEPHLGVVLRYPEEQKPRAPRLRAPAFISPGGKATGCVLGLLASRYFATEFGNALRGIAGCRLHTLVTPDGAAAESVRDAAGFDSAATDDAAVLDNPDINAVLIAEPGEAAEDHALRALALGKNVLVMGLPVDTRDALHRLVRARSRASGFLMIGGGHRLAPLAVRLRDETRKRGGAKFLLVRAAARAEPAGPAGLWPYVDLARNLMGDRIMAVHVNASRLEASGGALTVTLNFSQGGLATVVWTAGGPASKSRIRVEAQAGGAMLSLDDFRTLSIAADGESADMIAADESDFGVRAEIEAFVAAVAAAGTAPVAEAEIVESALAAAAAFESLQTGKPIEL